MDSDHAAAVSLKGSGEESILPVAVAAVNAPPPHKVTKAADAKPLVPSDNSDTKPFRSKGAAEELSVASKPKPSASINACSDGVFR